jgi:hypothetical protein
MDYQIERRSDAVVPASGRLPAVRYFNAGMTCAVASGVILEGLWLARDPGYAIGGLAAGVTIALGGLGLIAGVSWLFRLIRPRL